MENKNTLGFPLYLLCVVHDVFYLFFSYPCTNFLFSFLQVRRSPIAVIQNETVRG